MSEGRCTYLLLALALPCLSGCGDAWLFATQDVVIQVTDLEGGALDGVEVTARSLSDVIWTVPDTALSDKTGHARIVLRPVVKACGTGLTCCTERRSGHEGEPFAIGLTTADSSEVLELTLTRGATATGTTFRIMLVEVGTPVPDSPPDAFFADCRIVRER